MDAGVGSFIKVEVGNKLDLCLQNGDKLERWESNGHTASDRRDLPFERVATALDTVDNHAGYRFRLFETTWSLRTADATGLERINQEGLTGRLASRTMKPRTTW